MSRYGAGPLPRPTTRQDDTGSGGWAGERAGTGFLKQSLTGWRRDGDDLILAVRLTPGATREDVGGRWTDEHGAHWLSARVRAVPHTDIPEGLPLPAPAPAAGGDGTGGA